jgi:GntR family transcriptional regulator/MocR family aminotransferase
VLSGGGPHGQGPHVSGIAAGLHAVLDLPRTDLEHDMIARASERGLALDGLERYRAGPGPGPGGDRAGLVIGYARPPEHAYTTALARLRAVVSS